MIEDIKLLIRLTDGKNVEVGLEPQRVKAVVKLLGLEVDGEIVTMVRRKWRRENKNLISDKQLSLFGKE